MHAPCGGAWSSLPPPSPPRNRGLVPGCSSSAGPCCTTLAQKSERRPRPIVVVACSAAVALLPPPNDRCSTSACMHRSIDLLPIHQKRRKPNRAKDVLADHRSDIQMHRSMAADGASLAHRLQQCKAISQGWQVLLGTSSSIVSRMAVRWW